MLKKTLLCLLVGVCIGCDVRRVEKEWLQLKANSLKSELESSRNTVEALLEVGKLIDSIDANRYDLIALLEEGKPPFNNYKNRMLAINEYVRESQLRIDALDEKLNKLKDSAPGYAEVIDGLNEKIKRRSRELNKLRDQLARHLHENDDLFQMVHQREAELVSNDDHLKSQNEELRALEIKIAIAMDEYRIVEAEAYYGEAVAIEEKANRTRFAAGKKREALKEALELYKRAVQYGKEEAKSKVLELEKKI